MVKKYYELVNPRIQGTITSELNTVSRSSDSAAKKIYAKLAGYFGNHVDEFNFIIKSDNNKLHHFSVSENKNGDNVSYSMYKIENVDPKINDHFAKLLASKKSQTGGKHKHKSDSVDKIIKKIAQKSNSDSDSDSDSESSSYHGDDQPISNYMYYYVPYQTTKATRVSQPYTLFMPAFNLLQYPTIQVSYDMVMNIW